MSREFAVQEERYVVEVREAVPAQEVSEAAGRVAARLHMDVARVLKLLDRRTGPVTKPLRRDKADAIADTFVEAGVAVSVRPAHEGDAALASRSTMIRRVGMDQDVSPPSVFLSSTRWVPSPHDDVVMERPERRDEGPFGEDAGRPRGAPPYAPTYRAPGEGGLDLRAYLLIGLAVSLILLLVLQSINAGRTRRLQPVATVEAGMDAYRGGDFARAQRIWQPLADAGNPRAQYMLGYMAENGQGRPWSNRDAAEYYRQAALQGLPEAQLGLGSLYLRGMGVERDTAQAADLFRQAAQAGYGPAEYRYAQALFQGEGVPQDFPASLRWFRAAADHGVQEAEAYVRFAQGLGAGTGDAPAAP